jgi:hypothetical protein
MSTLWTPGGEIPLRRQSQTAPGPAATPRARYGPSPEPQAGGDQDQKLAELTQRLLSTPVEVLVANHAYGLFELASLHLSQRPANFAQARLAIDAFAALVEGLGNRLGEAAKDLEAALAQIREAFVVIWNAQKQDSAKAPPTKQP